MERLSKREKLSPEEMRILEAAVLWSASEEQRIRQHYGRKKKNKCNLRTG